MTPEKTEKTETEPKTTPVHPKHADAAAAVILSDTELAAKGFFHRGGNWGIGMVQDFRNVRLAPSGTKTYHFIVGTVKALTYVSIAEGAYNLGKWCLAKIAARRAAAKLASKLTGLEVGDAVETAMTATAAVY